MHIYECFWNNEFKQQIHDPIRTLNVTRGDEDLGAGGAYVKRGRPMYGIFNCQHIYYVYIL